MVQACSNIFIFSVRKAKFRVVKELARGHTARGYQSHAVNVTSGLLRSCCSDTGCTPVDCEAFGDYTSGLMLVFMFLPPLPLFLLAAFHSKFLYFC